MSENNLGNPQNPSVNRTSPARDSNQKSPKYKTRTLLLEECVW
jgi:hypothetical protein